MQTLFDYQPDDEPPTASQEEMLRDAMKKQWDRDQEAVKARGIIPDWMGEPSPLSKDRARLLTLLYEVGCITWRAGPCQNNRDVTKAMGLTNTANAKAVIDACMRDGLIGARIYRGDQIFEMLQEGEYALEEYQVELELGLV